MHGDSVARVGHGTLGDIISIWENAVIHSPPFDEVRHAQRDRI
jgi:hypothetical protein